MIALLGEAEAGSGHPRFRSGSLHSFVAMVNEAEPARSIEILTRELSTDGYVAVIVHEVVKVPRWRGLLPTEQGRAIRHAMLHRAKISVYADDNREARDR